MIRQLLLILSLFVFVPGAVHSQEPQPETRYYTGKWETDRNLKLSGLINAVLVEKPESCKIKVAGKWEGEPYEYEFEMVKRVGKWVGFCDGLRPSLPVLQRQAGRRAI